MKKILALITALVMVSHTIVFAAPKTEEKEIEKSVEYQALELLSGYIADRYIDSSYTTEDLMMLGFS